jgi:hypothetical protein
LILKLFRKKKKKPPEPVKPEVIPWDVPLDQTTGNIRVEGGGPIP